MDARRIDRRSFLRGGAAVVGGATLGAAGTVAWERARPAPGGPTSGAASAGSDPAPVGSAVVPFRGDRQPGVTTPPQAFATLVAFDLLPGADRDAVVRLMRIWTDDADRLMSGRAGLADLTPELAARPASLTVTVGYGPGVFAAAGLERSRPSWLAPLPPFGVDRLQDRWSGGDLLVQVCADDAVAVSHAVRVLSSDARTLVRTRWVQRGFRHAPGATAPGATMRNLMGQLDGTRNIVPPADDALIWQGADAPPWLAGGTAMVVRRIAIDLDTWDSVDRTGREFALGRRLGSGAPLTGTAEHDEPDLDATTDVGLPVIDAAAHIRRARSDDPEQRFLRRPYNYDDDPEPGQITNAGLLFVTFQRDPVRQFVPIQRRLDQLDLLNQWTTPIGSAVFAVPAGCREGEYLGQALLES